MKHSACVILCVLLGMVSGRLWAQSHTVSGTVTDKANGETLIGCTIYDQRTGKGTTTNAYGHYTLTLKGDSALLRISYMGYQTQQLPLSLTKNISLNVQLQPSMELEEVVITAEKPTGRKASQMSAIEVPVEQIKAVPVLFGEADVLKALQLLPGVQSGSEGTAGMYVRGGGPDENLFLLDGVPLYNVNHLCGFFSAFNSDAVKNVTLYKGSFPARFGGRLSSVLDITTNNGNDKEYHGNASIGFVSAKINVEGPIVKEKTTFSLSARRTYGDVLILPIALKILKKEDDQVDAGYYFYDINAKITHKFSDKSRLYGSFYLGDDVFQFKVNTSSTAIGKTYMGMKYNWGNLVGSLRWNYELTPQLFMNTTASYTRYRNNMAMSVDQQNLTPTGWTSTDITMGYNSGIQDASARIDFDYKPAPEHDIRFGANYLFHCFTPEVSTLEGELDGEDVTETMGSSKVYAHEMMLFAEDDWELGERIKLNLGINVSGFVVGSKLYCSPQPRLSGRLMINDDLSLKVGYARMTQYAHLLSNSTISLPTDLWVPVTENIEPMTSNQVACGLFYNLFDLLDLSVEGYYKHMNNLLEYKQGASFWGSSKNWENKVCSGEGRSYGFEVLAQRTKGRFTGWVGYTWSHTDHLFDRPGQRLNNGEWFPAKYDRRHDVSVVLTYRPSDRFDVSLTWVYSTGNAVTLGLQEYESVNNIYGDSDRPQTVTYIEKRNDFRMPDYHRMDVSCNFYRKFSARISRVINISVYNVYNRQNPYMIYKKDGEHYGNYNSALVQLAIFPILPSVAYTLKF